MFDKHAGVAQLVERHPSKVNVAGSNLVSRSTKTMSGTASRGIEYGSSSGRRAVLAWVFGFWLELPPRRHERPFLYRNVHAN